jgi:hypothetical protein
VYGFENGAFVSNVTGRRQSETADETRAHVGENVAVEIWHDKNLVVVGNRICDHLQASIVEEFGIKFNIGIFFAYLARRVQEQTVGHLHDSGFVHRADLLPPYLLSMLEGKSQNPLGCFPGDELYTLNNAIDNNMLNAGVFTLGVLTNENSVDVVVRSLVPYDGPAGSEVGEKVESAAEGQVQRDMALSNRCLKAFSLCLNLENRS